MLQRKLCQRFASMRKNQGCANTAYNNSTNGASSCTNGRTLGKKKITEAHDLKIAKSISWTDSKIALCWLRADARNYKPFVMYRIAEIQELTGIQGWHYIPTKVNVADLVQNGINRLSMKTIRG